MSEYIEANRLNWDDRVPIHLASASYDVASFKAGRSTLHHVEREELGEVHGKTLLHLQCHFGLDTLSWAREGAIVTGVDFSGAAIEAAKALAAETGIEARFIESNVYELESALQGEFDIVFASYGVLEWLPDVMEWARVAAGFVKPGGTLYIIDAHPFGYTLDDETEELTELKLRYPYFLAEPLVLDGDGTYADRSAKLEHRRTYSFQHTLGEIVSSFIDAGLRIDFLHEFPFAMGGTLPGMKRGDDRFYRLPSGEDRVPFLYSIRAQKLDESGT